MKHGIRIRYRVLGSGVLCRVFVRSFPGETYQLTGTFVLDYGQMWDDFRVMFTKAEFVEDDQ